MDARGHGIAAEASEPPRARGRRKRVLTSHAADLSCGALQLRLVEASRAEAGARHPGQVADDTKSQGSAAKRPAPSHVGIVETTRRTRHVQSRQLAEPAPQPKLIAPARPGFGQIAGQLVAGQALPGILFWARQSPGAERAMPRAEPAPEAASAPPPRPSKALPDLHSAADARKNSVGAGRVDGHSASKAAKERQPVRPFRILQQPHTGAAVPAGTAEGAGNWRGLLGGTAPAPNEHSLLAWGRVDAQRTSLKGPKVQREQPEESRSRPSSADRGPALLAQRPASSLHYPAAPTSPALPPFFPTRTALPEFPDVCAQLADCTADGGRLPGTHGGKETTAASNRSAPPSAAGLVPTTVSAAAQGSRALNPNSCFSSNAPALNVTTRLGDATKGPPWPKLHLPFHALHGLHIQSRFPALPWFQIGLRQPRAQHLSSLQIRSAAAIAGASQGNTVKEGVPGLQESKGVGQRGPLLLNLRLQLWAPIALLSIPCLPRLDDRRLKGQSAPATGGHQSSKAQARDRKTQDQAFCNLGERFHVFRKELEHTLAPAKETASRLFQGTSEGLHQSYQQQAALMARFTGALHFHATQALHVFRHDLAFVLQAANSSRHLELGRLPPSAAHLIMHGVVAASLLPDTLGQLARMLGAHAWDPRTSRRVGSLVPRALPGLRCRKGKMLETAEAQAWPAFGLPVEGGWLSSLYGWRDGRFHQGVDIAVEENTAIAAAAAGTVLFVGWRGGYGKVVHIDHGDGCKTLYAHCNKLFVKKGQSVRTRQRIALSGNTGKSTGPHLHFEIQRNGGTVDPLMFLPQIDHTKLPLYRYQVSGLEDQAAMMRVQSYERHRKGGKGQPQASSRKSAQALPRRQYGREE